MINLILILASCIQGMTSFGFSLVALPLLSLVMPIKEIVPLLIMFSIVINIVLFFQLRKDMKIKHVLPLLLGGLIGLPFGVVILNYVEGAYLKKVAGGMIFLIALLMFLGFKVKLKQSQKWYFPVGILSGIMQGSLSLSGPPIVFFLTNQGCEKHVFRANLTAYFTFLNIISLPVLITSKVMVLHGVIHNLSYVPSVLIGIIIGMLLVKYIPQQLFKRLTLLLMAISGLAALFL